LLGKCFEQGFIPQNGKHLPAKIRAAIDDLPIAKDVIVATAEQVAGTYGRPRGVLHWALAEGRILYERV